MVATMAYRNGSRFQRVNTPQPPTAETPPRSQPDYGVDIGRLTSAIQTSQRILKRYRIERRELVRQLAGSHYSDDGAFKEVPLNLLSLYTEIVGRSLIAKEPRVMLGTFERRAKPIVSVLQDWMNDRMEEMGVAETLQRWVMDAMISVGILKIALAGAGESALAGYGVAPGMPFMENVDLDDFAFDHGATRLKWAGFFAHRVRVPHGAAQKQYGRKGKRLVPSSVTSYNPGQGDERTSNIGRGSRAQAEEFEDMTVLWEVYLPRRRQVIVLAGDGSGFPTDFVLEAKPWIGPACGPYHFLGYLLLPGNPMPKGPLLDLVPLHLVANRLARKLNDQALRQKTNLGVRGPQLDQAQRIIQTPDGEALKFEGESPVVLRWGGPEPVNVQYLDLVKQLFDWRAGNLSLQGGLNPMSKTAAQDSMLNNNAAAGVADKQDTTVRGVAEAMSSLGWFYYHHPDLVMQTNWNPPGMPEYGITRNLYPFNPSSPAHGHLMANRELMRALPWSQIRMRVDPYSMRHQTPQQRATDLIGLVKEIILPMMPILAQQGKFPNMDRFLYKLGQYRDMVDLNEIIEIGDPIEGTGAGGGVGGMPQSTSREYVRRSAGGDSSQGSQLNELQNFFAGAAASAIKTQPAAS